MILSISGLPASEDFLIRFSEDTSHRPLGQLRITTEDGLRTYLTKRVKLNSDDLNRAIEQVSLRQGPNSRHTIIENLPLSAADAYSLLQPAK